MEEKSVPSSTPPSTPETPREATGAKLKHEQQPWRPRVDSQREWHAFGNETPEADSILESPRVRDPEEDTAPLQGSKDRSDDDSLEDTE